jgi:hypothetical protein
MNCFYHPDLASVAACVDCGKGLCPECARRYTILICDECNEKRVKAEKQVVIRQYIPSAFFFIVGLFFVLKLGGDIVSAIILGYLLAGALWGWKVISFIQPRMFLFLSVAGWGLYFIIKYFLSLFAGIVAMPIGIAMIIVRHARAISKGKNIDRNKNNA